jgi:ABC-type polysaccharide/polyol phosphate export permease
MLWYLAWSETRARYRRSTIGPFWITLGTGVGIIGLGVLWSSVFDISHADFIPYLAGGLIVWQMISGCLSESAAIFTRQARMIHGLCLPYTFYPMQLLARQFINFSHNMVFFLAVTIYYGLFGQIHWPFTLVGVILVMLNLFWIILLLGMLGARYRDIEPLMNMIVPLMFFMSPILFRGEQLAYGKLIVWSNPASYMIMAIREPLLGRIPEAFIYLVLLGLLIIGGCVTFILFARKRDRLPFWV